MSDDDVAMQNRCVSCLTEHYALHVIAISYGDVECPYCGHQPTKMTKTEYFDALSAAREKAWAKQQPTIIRPPRQRQTPE